MVSLGAPTISDSVQLALDALTEKVRVIDARSESQSVIFGDISFRSRDEVKDFVQLHMMKGSQVSWRGFYDGHSLLDGIRLRHTTLNANAGIRVKVDKLNLTMEEALIANSFENEIPTMFAVGQKDSDLTSFPLPALRFY